MAPIVGDRVAVQTKRVDASERLGTVEAVLAQSPPRYQVRWDNGGWSIITAAALRVVSTPAGGKRRAGRRTTAPKKN